MMRYSLLILSLAGLGLAAAPAFAQTFTVHNPLPVARPDAVIDLPTAAAARSAVIGGELYPVQRIGDRLRLVAPVAANATFKVALSDKAPPPEPKRVQVTLNVQEGGTLKGDPDNGGAISGGTFHLHDSFTAPKDHFIHDGLLGFEGIGWESDRVAYRLYLDQRNVTDLFGKYGTGMIYRKIGLGFDDYQYPRAWGGDIYKVGDALGVGGLGFLRGDKATQTGPSTITGRMVADGPVTAIAGVDADAIGGGEGSLHAAYAISAGSTLTEVTAHADKVGAPLLTGLTVHPGDLTIRSDTAGDWRYIAVWGAQEHGPDKVGTVVFYRAADVTGAPVNDGQTLYVQFRGDDANYDFAGRWVQENKDVKGARRVTTLAGFKTWLEAERRLLAHPLDIRPS
jgi:hypothetical protein